MSLLRTNNKLDINQIKIKGGELMRKRRFTKHIGLIVSEEIYNRIIEETNREEKTVSGWIREAIEMRLNKDSFKTNEPENKQTKED